VDDFEEVVIPKHQAKIKPPPKQPTNPSNKNTASKQKSTSKQTQLSSPSYRTTKQDRRRPASKKSPQLLDGASRDGVSDWDDDGTSKKITGKLMKYIIYME